MAEPGAIAERSLLDELLPRFDTSEVHEVWIAAHPTVVFAAVKQVTVREVRLLTPLEALRGLPSLLTGRPAFHLITETRVAGTSPEATQAVLRYWRVIRLGSGAIRRSWLAAIRRRAAHAGSRSAKSA